MVNKLEIKICTNCKIKKVLSEFSPRKEAKDKHAYRCKECNKKIASQKRKKLAAIPYEEKNVPESKICYACHNNKNITEFCRKKGTKDGHSFYCKDCAWDKDLQRNFNITAFQWQELYDNQNGCCYICHKPETVVDSRTKKVKELAVDHFEFNGEKIIRGLLCQKCNTGIGALGHNRNILLAAIDYLDRFKIIDTKC